MVTSTISIQNLVKHFGHLAALDNLSFSVKEGEFFGLLGPNGAGKTTLIRILCTLIKPTSGTARIMEFDVVENRESIRRLIGVVPQAMTSDLDLTARENLDIYARFYDIPKKVRRNRIEELLSMIELMGRADDLVATYSGGMRRRLEMARGLIHKPSVLILDEPTLGLDPQSRHTVWGLLQRFREEEGGLTILLTTHYMEEAEVLCDRVAIIDYGKIVAIDTIEGLKKEIPQKEVVELKFRGAENGRIIKWAKALSSVYKAVIKDGILRVSVDNGAQAIPLLVDGLIRLGAEVTSVQLREQTLEDVFIHFTGRPIREEEVKKISFLIGAGVPQKWGR